MNNANTPFGKKIDEQKPLKSKLLEILTLFVVIYIFLVSLDLLGASFKLFGEDFAANLVASTSNPFIGLFIGILATAIVQSSSTTTSIVVALVASGAYGAASDPSTISLAVFIILGANIGTSVTSTIVALGHIRRLEEFKRAIAGATVHDFFNIINVIILFPLELIFGILSKPATALANALFVGGGSGGILDIMKFVKHSVRPTTEGIIGGTKFIIGAEATFLPVITTILAFIILFGALRGLTWALKRILIGNIQKKVDTVLFGNSFKALAWGVGVTTLVQSSSVTTSLSVPLVATGKVTLEKVFPFLMGANIGTTTTALIAALVSTSAVNPIAGLAIAFCHLFFNLIGVCVFYPIPQIRRIPIKLAKRLAEYTGKNRLYGIAYVATAFFVIPAVLIMVTQGFDTKKVSDVEEEKAPAVIPMEKSQTFLQAPVETDEKLVMYTRD